MGDPLCRRPPWRMGFLTLLCCLPLTAEEPLAEAGEDAQAVREALAALAHGDARPLADLPGRAWEHPPALPDPVDPHLARRWTLLVPAALARAGAVLPPLAPPADAPAAWDRPWHPAAAELLRRAGQQAWDLGQREDALLLGWSPASWTPRLPGSARRAAGRPPAAAVRVLARRDWLVGLDPWGRVRWQRRLPRGVAAVGGTAAAIVGPEGAGLVATDGHWTPLPPVPPGTTPQAASSAGAWFSLPTPWRVWWVARGGAPAAVDLPLRTLGAPLVQEAWSCWLDEDGVTLVEGARVIGRSLHGVPVASGATLLGNLTDPWLADGQGGLWRLDGPALAQATRPLPPSPDPGHLVGDRKPAGPAPRHDSDGSWWADGSRIVLEEDRGRTQVTSTGTRAWTCSWTSPPALEAPGRHLAVQGDRVVVLEGLRWLTVLDRRDGRRLRHLEAPGADPAAATADHTGLTAWWLGDQLRVAEPGQPGRTLATTLAGTLVGVDRGILVLAPGESWLLEAGQAPRTIPTPAWQDPRPLPGGIGDGAWLWPWATAPR